MCNSALQDCSIVISGISLRLPESNNIEEFASNLFNGIDMITDDDDDRRWTKGIYGLPQRSGKLKNIEKFDAEFFNIPDKQANVMDPMQRLLLEVTFEALYDAGINPSQIQGSKTGVFIGAAKSESSEILSSDPDLINEYNLTGHSRGMFANGISYYFNLNGPSLTTETACSSSLIALERAVLAIRSGQCESAIVGGANLLLKPQASLEFHKLGMLSLDGKCKAFDKSANGYVRSEAIVVIYIQKLQTALKSYATILNIKSNSDGYKEQGITYPSGQMQQTLLEEVYSDINLDSNSVKYIEAHGTGTAIGDPQELNAITNYFCGDNRNPLLIGSIKSNMGHSEHASGLCSLAKVIVAIVYGQIPPNLHYTEANPNIPGLVDGRLKVVNQKQKLPEGIIGINSFGFGGSNVHLILQPNKFYHKGMPSSTSTESIQQQLPILIPFSGRTENSTTETLEILKNSISSSCPINIAYLLYNIYQCDILNHAYRGFLISNNNIIVKRIKTSFIQKLPFSPHENINSNGIEKSQIWFIFSGMGSQWPGMANSLLTFKPFRESIEECVNILKPYNIDLWNILTSHDDKILDSTINSFVGIAAMQIGLVDLLSTIGIDFNAIDGFIGHSIGENICSYVAGLTTKTETLLIPYWAGRLFEESGSELKPGTMASIGLSWENASAKCPSAIHLACHNSADNVSVAGPIKEIQEFISDCTRQGIFAREIKVGQAFHSPHISILETNLAQVLLNNHILNGPPMTRSNKWISTSFPESEWDSQPAKCVSPAYFAHNLISPVYFKEAIDKIPEGSLVIEIGPHCLLQPILKRGLSTRKNTSIIGLSNKNVPNNTIHLLESIGKFWTNGYNINLSKLRPENDDLNNLAGPFLSPMVKWNHEKSYRVVNFEKEYSKSSHMNNVKISLETHKYLKGYKLNDQIFFPSIGYLTLIWSIFAQGKSTTFENLPVIFENVKFYKAIPIKDGVTEKEPTVFNINMLEGSGKFEVMHNQILVVSGQVKEATTTGKQQIYTNDEDLDLAVNVTSTLTDSGVNSSLIKNKAQIYEKFRSDGWELNEAFQGLDFIDYEENTANLTSNGNWITYLENLIQFQMLCQSKTSSSEKSAAGLGTTLSYLRYAYLDPNVLINYSRHSKSSSLMELEVAADRDKKMLTAKYMKYQNTLVAPGVEMSGLHFELLKDFLDTLQTKHDLKLLKMTSTTNLTISHEKEKLNPEQWMTEGSELQKNPTYNYELCEVCYTWGEFPNESSHSNNIKNTINMKSFSGVNSSNEKVMGLVFPTISKLSTKILIDPEFVWKIPNDWSIQEAAPVPFAYSFGYYALLVKAELKANESILIPFSNNSNEFCQAMIQIALGLGCCIYTTVSNIEDKKCLISNFPNLNQEQIICINSNQGSSKYSFAYQILDLTAGRGVNVILNTTSSTMSESIECLAQHGRLLNIYQSNNSFSVGQNCSIGMACFLKNITMHGISLDDNTVEKHSQKLYDASMKKQITKYISNGIQSGLIKPIKIRNIISATVENSNGNISINENQVNQQGLVILKII